MRSLLLLCFCCIMPAAAGQSFSVRKYSVEQGLSHANVFRSFQDRRGFMWFATNYGLSCFNGAYFKNYTTADGLPDNTVLSVSDAGKGLLAISTKGGISLLRNDSVLEFPLHTAAPFRNVQFTVKEGSHTWAITTQGQDGNELYRIEQGRLQRMPVKGQENKAVHFYSMLPAQKGGMLFACSEGIYRAGSSGLPEPFMQHIVKEPVYLIRQDAKGCYWIALKDRILYTDAKRVIWSYLFAGGGAVSDMLADRNGNVWVALHGYGLMLISDFKPRDVSSLTGVDHITVNNIFEDHEGNIWFATHGEGLYMLLSKDVTDYPTEDKKLNVYANVICRDTKRSILLGSLGTLSAMQGNTIQALKLKSLHSADYIYFARECRGQLLIGIPRGLIIKRGAAEFFINDDIGALSCCEDDKGNTWLGHYRGLSVLKKQQLVRQDYPALNGRRVNALLLYNNMLLAGTDKGAWLVQGKHCVPYSDSNINVRQLFTDSRQRLWMASDNGLMLRQKQGWQVYDESKGLNHKKCNAVAEDQNGNIWVGTMRGLALIDGTALKVLPQDLVLYMPREVLSLLSDGSTMLAGTISGIIRVPVNRSSNAAKLQTYITSVKPGAVQQFYPVHTEIGASEKKFSIEYIGINYALPAAVEYAYKIEHYDTGWHLTKDHSIQVSALPPGHYVFMVKSRLLGRPWGNVASLDIIKHKAFWQQGWFYVLVIALLVLVLYLCMRLYFNKRQKKERAKLEMDNKMTFLEQQALAAQINPHFIFNCLNSIQYYLNKNDKELANKYLSGFAKLIRMTLEYSRETYILLNKEIGRLDIYLQLEKLRCGKMLSYRVDIEEGLNTEAIMIPNMIVQPYIENAIWHGIIPKQQPGTVELLVKRAEPGIIRIMIKDDGVGIYRNTEIKKENTAAHQHSFGMSIVAQRLGYLNDLENTSYKVEVLDRLEHEGIQGTCIRISVPYE